MADSTVQIRFIGDSRSATSAVRGLEGSFSSLGRTARTLIGVAGIAGIGIALKKAGQAAVDFDAGMRNVNSLAKMSERDLAALSKQVLALAGPTAQAPKTLAEGLYDIVSSGFSANDAVKILAVSAKAATAGLTDTATATKAVTAVLNAYQLQASDSRKVSDVLFQTVNKGVLTFEELASSIGDVLPFASQLGVPLEEIGAAMATMTLQGLSAAESSTRLKGVLVQMLKPNADLASAIHDLGFASGEAMIKQEGLVGSVKLLDGAAKGNKETIAAWMGDIRAIGGFLALSGDQLKTFTANAKAMDDATKGAGATAGAFAEQSKSLAFQWERAKQSLAAAAIPIATLLFPALVKGAQAVADFAGKVSAHMPQIKAAFDAFISPLAAILERVADGIRGASSALASMTGFDTATGSAQQFGGILAAVVVGLTAYKTAVLLAKVATIGLSTAVTRTPMGMLISLAIAAGAALGTLASQAEDTATGFDRAADAMNRLKDLQNTTADSAGQLRDANLRVEQAELSVAQAIKARNSMLRGLSGAEREAVERSLAYRQAQLGVKQAYAELDRSEKNRESTIARLNGATKGQVDQSREFRGALLAELDGQRQVAAGMSEIERAANKPLDLLQLEEFVKISGRAGKETQDFAAAAYILRQSLDRIPTKKEIATFVKTEDGQRKIKDLLRQLDIVAAKKPTPKVDANTAPSAGKLKKVLQDLGSVDRKRPKPKVDADVAGAIRSIQSVARALAGLFNKTVTVTTYQRTVSNVDQRRAGGGFITGPDTGGADSVLAMVAPGEMVLNRSQQHALGGPARLASMFGFSTAGVPGFQAGGIIPGFAAGGVVPSPDPAPSGGRGGKRGKGRKTGKGRYKAKAQEVKQIQRQLDRNEDDQEIANREYDRLAREFDITTEEFLTVDGKGNETLNKGAVDQRVGELTQMIAKKNEIIGLVQKEKDLLGQLLAALEAAAEAYMVEVRRQQAIVKAETHVIQELNRRIARSDGDDRPGLETQLAKHEANRDKAKAAAEKFRGKAKDMRAEKPDVRRNYRLVDQDILDLGVDVRYLEAEIADVKSVKPQAGGGAGSSSGGDSGGGTDSANNEAALKQMIEELKRRIGELTLALGIESAQLPIIASFAKGTIHVPQTGLYELHAGEEVVPRNRPRGGDGGSIGDVVIQMNVPDSMAWLMRQVDARVVRGAANVSVVIGRQADIRRREGRI